MKSKLLTQYNTEAQRHPDKFVFVQLGDFLEIFGDNAKTVADELNITLTSRVFDTETGERTFLTGFPVHQASEFFPKLSKPAYIYNK